MPTIDIRHPHALPKAEARNAMEAIAVKLADRFGIEYQWEDDTLRFTRAGVNGQIALLSKELHVQAQLGFLLAALKGPIEQEIKRYLEEKFG